jgi:hypothetical protein
MAFYNFFAHGESDPGPRVLGSVVKPLEHLEDAVEISRLNPNPVVLNPEYPLFAIFPSRNVNQRRPVSTKLDSVAY